MDRTSLRFLHKTCVLITASVIALFSYVTKAQDAGLDGMSSVPWYSASLPIVQVGYAAGAATVPAPPAPYKPTSAPVATTSESSDDIDRTRYEASTYVPVDSWVYPALERLMALGYIRTGSLAIRPITRLECQRLLAEAHTINNEAEIDSPQDDPNIPLLLAALDREFVRELLVTEGDRNVNGTISSVYARFNGIAGRPLRDSYHFGQTTYNDFGRPYGQGSNVVAGFAGHSEYGPFAIYARGEFQHAASSPAYSAAAQQTIENFDVTTEILQIPPGTSAPLFNFNPAAATRVRLVEGYVAMNLANWQISAGQQSLWWGPDRSTSLILSNNAAALPMIRIARATPGRLPSLLKYFGPVRFDGFFAREGGIHYLALTKTFQFIGNANQGIDPPPYMWGAAVSTSPTPNFEFAFTHTVIFAGYGRPLNLRTFIHTFNSGGNQQVKEPGKRVTEFNASYHVPWLRRRLVAYSEAMAWDDPVQGHFTERFALAPGFYVSQVPGVKKLDLRLEGFYTDLPGLPYVGYFYANSHYSQGYTNYGQIMGSWVGRQGRGGQGMSTYWFSAQTKATATFRRMVANPQMLHGGDLTDVAGDFSWQARPRMNFSTKLQYERWRFPVISAGPTSNLSVTFQIELLNPWGR